MRRFAIVGVLACALLSSWGSQVHRHREGTFD